MDTGKVRWYHLLGAIAGLTVLAFFLSPASGDFRSELDPESGELGIVQVSGAIAFGGGQDTIGPTQVSDLTDRAVANGADVLLYEINSGGGAVVASRQTAQVVRDAPVPTVCRMKEVAASGGYWVASACDVVVADPLTLTGSIGVTSTYLEFSGLLERFGVEYVNLTSGEYKDMGSQYKNLTPEEREKFQDLLDTSHEFFVSAVAENRNMTDEEVERVANGEIILGTRAASAGLVDRVGGREVAVEAAKELSGKETLRSRTYSPPRRFDLLSLLFSKIGEGIAEGLRGETGFDRSVAES